MMSRIYDNWEKLVGAVVRREKDRQLAYCESFNTTSSTDLSSRFSFVGDVHLSAEVSRISDQKFDLSSHNIFVFQNVMVIEYDIIRNFQHDMLVWKEGSGRVHKGWIDEQFLTTAAKPRSGTAVSVKRMENESGKQEHKEWVVEINYLGQAGHPNWAKLIGYSFHINNSFLKYEFLPKGSLDTYMLSRWHQSPPWTTRIKVAAGAARALTLLHDLEIPTTHDGLWDFGLTIQGPFGVINQVGATGAPYAAPEYIATGHLSAECDVYSFGVVLVELMSGRRALDRSRAPNYLMNWVRPYLGDKKETWLIMDSRLMGQYPREEAVKVGKIASQCLSLVPTSRPTMAEVVAALQQLM